MFIRSPHGFVSLFVSPKSRGETAAYPSNTDHRVLLHGKGCAGCVKQLAVRGRAGSSSPAEMDIWNSSGPQRTLLIQPKTEYITTPPPTHTIPVLQWPCLLAFSICRGRDNQGLAGREGGHSDCRALIISVQKSK